jgi:hypothetical protein
MGTRAPTCENGRFRPHSAPSGTSSVALLIRGFGVQVPGGAPVLTWYFCHLFRLVDGRFAAMVAPRLLVSPNIVDHGDRTPGEAPTDGYTQRDIWRKGAGRGIAADAAQGNDRGDALAPWSRCVGAVGPGSPARYTRGLQVHARSIALRNRESRRQRSRVLRAALRSGRRRPVSAGHPAAPGEVGDVLR